MDKGDIHSFDRRLFVGGSALALLGMTEAARAQGGTITAREAKPLSRQLSEFIVGFDLKQVPASVVERARIGFIDTLGVMLAGSHEEVSAIVCEMVKAEGAAPSTTVVGQSFRTSPQLAALANGVAAHAMDYDFTFIIGQSVSPVIPAILPVAETVGATPAECVAAFIVGCEVASRIVRANFHASMVSGWHTVGMVGCIAAAAASARLMKLPVDKIPDVLGISVSMASGRSVNFGTMTKPLHSGHAARDAVMAALLGSRGFTAHATSFEGKAGYFDGFGRGLEVTYDPFKDLGSRYDIETVRFRFKPYPCGGLTHTLIEAALELRGKVGNRLADITNIHTFVTRNAAGRAGTQWPTTVEGAKFSVSYLAAYSLVHGEPKIAAFTEAALHDPKLPPVGKLVTASVDPALGDGTDGSPARVKITMRDGQVFELQRDHATGSNERPMTTAQMDEKFTDCAVQVVSRDAARTILAALKAMPDRPSMGDLWPLLRRA
jgi:2-methylcitrate dehydratase PrpD